MRFLLAIPDEDRLTTLRDILEGRDEHTCCTTTHSGLEALNMIYQDGYDAAVIDAVLKDMDGLTLLSRLMETPPVQCPFTLLFGQSNNADACIDHGTNPKDTAQALYTLLEHDESVLHTHFAQQRYTACEAFLDSIRMSASLKGRMYLREMIPLALSHLKYREDLKYRIYPYTAKCFGVTPASVERCVRHAIETTFSHGNLDAIDRFFGQSYDAERGKPTNREFIAMAIIHLKEDCNL